VCPKWGKERWGGGGKKKNSLRGEARGDRIKMAERPITQYGQNGGVRKMQKAQYVVRRPTGWYRTWSVNQQDGLHMGKH